MQKKPHLRHLSSRRTVFGSILIFGLITTLFGCDTVARINFGNRDVRKIVPLGFTPKAGACGSTSTSDFVTRFLVIDEANKAVHEGENVGGASFELGQGNLSLDSTAVMEAGVQACTGTCSSSQAVCGGNSFVPFQACLLTGVSLSVGAGTQVGGGTRKSQVLGILVEDSFSTRGVIPNKYLGATYKDAKGEFLPPIQVTPAVASDSENGKSAMLSAWMGTLNNVRSEGQKSDVETYLSLYKFGEQVEAVRLNNTTLFKDKYRSASQQLGQLIQSQKNDTTASVFKAVVDVLKGNAGAQVPKLGDGIKDASVEKALFVVVDGPDDERKDVAEAIQAAQETNTKIFIIHFDPAYNEGLTGNPGNNPSPRESYPDYPHLYNNSPDCTDDSACYSYEECRKPQDFKPQGASTFQENTTNKCILKRDAAGRIGPVAAYSEIACATGGAYIYRPTRLQELTQEFSALPWVLDALWEAPVSASSSISSGEYQVVGTMKVKAGDKEVTRTFKAGTASKDDKRPVLAIKK